MSKPGFRKHKEQTILTIGLYVFLLAGAIIMVFPLFWMVSTSLKDIEQIFHLPIIWIPSPVIWKNYIDLFKIAPFVNWFFNSVIVSVSVTIGLLITSSLAAYAFGRMEFRGRDVLFLFFLGTMMIPMTVTLIPSYIMMKYFGWLNSYKALIIPCIFGPFTTFLLRQYFLTIPRSLEDAARIDGANSFYIYWHIIMPLAKPALISVSILNFTTIWNDYLWPLVILSSEVKKTMPVGLAGLTGVRSPNWQIVMAGTTLSTIPVLIAYVFMQRQVVEGISLTGIKG